MPLKSAWCDANNLSVIINSMRSNIFNFLEQKKPFILFSVASANQIWTCNLYLPTEESLFRAMVAMLKFSKFSQNSAEQINIARKKDNIYKHIRRPGEGFVYIKTCLLFNNYFHWSIKIYCSSLPTFPQNIYSCISKPEQTVRSDHHCCMCQRMLPGYAYNKIMPFLSFQWLT